MSPHEKTNRYCYEGESQQFRCLDAKNEPGKAHHGILCLCSIGQYVAGQDQCVLHTMQKKQGRSIEAQRPCRRNHEQSVSWLRSGIANRFGCAEQSNEKRSSLFIEAMTAPQQISMSNFAVRPQQIDK